LTVYFRLIYLRYLLALVAFTLFIVSIPGSAEQINTLMQPSAEANK